MVAEGYMMQLGRRQVLHGRRKNPEIPENNSVAPGRFECRVRNVSETQLSRLQGTVNSGHILNNIHSAHTALSEGPLNNCEHPPSEQTHHQEVHAVDSAASSSAMDAASFDASMHRSGSRLSAPIALLKSVAGGGFGPKSSKRHEMLSTDHSVFISHNPLCAKLNSKISSHRAQRKVLKARINFQSPHHLHKWLETMGVPVDTWERGRIEEIFDCIQKNFFTPELRMIPANARGANGEEQSTRIIVNQLKLYISDSKGRYLGRLIGERAFAPTCAFKDTESSKLSAVNSFFERNFPSMSASNLTWAVDRSKGVKTCEDFEETREEFPGLIFKVRQYDLWLSVSGLPHTSRFTSNPQDGENWSGEPAGTHLWTWCASTRTLEGQLSVSKTSKARCESKHIASHVSEPFESASRRDVTSPISRGSVGFGLSRSMRMMNGTKESGVRAPPQIDTMLSWPNGKDRERSISRDGSHTSRVAVWGSRLTTKNGESELEKEALVEHKRVLAMLDSVTLDGSGVPRDLQALSALNQRVESLLGSQRDRA